MAKRKRKLAARNDKKPTTTGGVAKWSETFVEYLRTECHLAENTVAAYQRDINRFQEWLGQQYLGSDLDGHQLHSGYGSRL